MSKLHRFIKWLQNPAGRKRFDAHIQQKEEKSKDMLRLAQVGIWERATDSDTVTWPEEIYRILDHDPAFTMPDHKDLSQILTPESWSRLNAVVDSVLEESCQTSAPCTIELELTRSDEAKRWIIVRGEAKRGANGHIVGTWGVIQDITECKAIQKALLEEKEWSQVTLNSIDDAVLSTDNFDNITYLNKIAEEMTGWSMQEALGRPLAEVFQIIMGNTRLPAPDSLELATQMDMPMGLTTNCILIRRDGVEAPIEDSTAPIHDATGQIAGAVIVFHDVSKSQAMSRQMAHLAQYDFLTHLPNRMLLNDRLIQAITLTDHRSGKLAILFLDLDQFKHINDSLGHGIGDALLRSVAERLKSCVRHSDTVSRQGGDEFLILLPDIENANDAALIAGKALTVMTKPHSIDKHDLYISVSIGISVYPNDGQDAETLIKNADVAMYHAKDNGRNNYQFFTQDMNTRSVERQSIESSLRQALRKNEFVLYYQPKFHLESETMIGAEALIRWRHPDRGLISPEQFISIAEDSGLILPIGRWVLHEACRQIRAWQEAGLRSMPMSINISALEFRGTNFIDDVRTTLKNTRLEPCYLEIELTESVLMQNAESATSVLKELKSIGVRLAIDDFGTGYSSLSYLSHFPIDVVKIDQSFIHEITTHPDNATIVSAIIGMCKGLKCQVVAEGVETREQAELLHARHCVEAQGYYFGQPMVVEEFTKWLGRIPQRQ